jgi:predicted Fe-Mo cluster-binding NifX family protein
MKIVVTASGTALDSPVDPRFGRCRYFIIVDPDSLEFEAVENENATASGGAGIQSAQFVAQKSAEAILTGSLGPNASSTLRASGLKVFLGAAGTVREAVQMFKNGQLQEAFGPSVQAHSGMGQQPGTGAPPPGFGPGVRGGMNRGMGMGMGRGIGMGRGMGRGMRRGMGMMSPTAPPRQPMTKEQEIQTLKDQTQALQDQLRTIGQRIDELSRESD